MGSISLKKVEPTVFFVREEGRLGHLVELTIGNDGSAADVVLRLKHGNGKYEAQIENVSPGEGVYRVCIPDIQQSMEVEFTLLASGTVQDRLLIFWKPQRHWLVYVIQRAHHDPSYTDLPQNLLEEYDDFYDSILRFCEETSGFPDDSRFRYQVETSWSILHYVRNRPKEVVEKLVGLMKDGRVEVAALFGNQITTLCGHEELVRLLYPSFELKRRYGVEVRSAEVNDIPGLSWGLATALANSGVRYLIAALPNWYFGEHHPNWDESEFAPHKGPRAFYWQGPDGSKVLFWYGKNGWDSEMCFTMGYEETFEQLPKRLKELEEQGYPFDAATFRVQGGHRDNSPPTVKPSYVAREWNEKWAYPRVIIATNTAFYEHIEERYGLELETYRGELPDTDYVVGATSTPLETGVNRATHDRLSSAEKFCTVAASISDYQYPKVRIEKAYLNMLMYDEHCWGMHHPLGPAQDSSISTKCGYAYLASALAHDCLSKSLNRIVDEIDLPEDSYYMVVFNPLSWKRTDVVQAYFVEPSPCGFPMHMRYEEGRPTVPIAGTAIGRSVLSLPHELLEEPFELVDEETGEKVPYQVVELTGPQAPTPFSGHRYAMGHVDRRHLFELFFLAKDVPSVGYKTYRVVLSQKKTDHPSSISVTDTSLESRFYKVSVDPKSGAITSIYDKELDVELVDSGAPHGFNQYLARSVTDGKINPALVSNVHRLKAGPVAGSLLVTGTGVGCPQISQEVILYDQVKRIDVSNRLLKDSTPMLELYFAYQFNLNAPEVKFEGSNSVITPLKDQIPGSNTDYYAVQHWAHLSDGKVGVIFSSLEAHLTEFGGLWPGYLSGAHHGVTYPGYGHDFLKPGEIKKGYVYSYVMNSNYRTNFQPVQVSDMLFRYSFTSLTEGWADGRAKHFGWGFQNPLVPVFMKGKVRGRLPRSNSFCIIDRPNVVLLTLKVAEDGDGVIARVAETEGLKTVTNVSLPFLNVSEAYLTSLQEENQMLLSCQRSGVTVPLTSFGIATIRVRCLT